MRVGDNPVRDQKIKKSDAFHRVIIPLYIPNEEGYYADAFEIFKYCLLSVKKTSNSFIKISVVSNGSCAAVNEKLALLFNEDAIDELIIEKRAIGKINSILKALRTADERLITVTDADVLFDNNWEKAVLDVFKAFPKAGSVSPVPVFRTHFRHTGNIWIKHFFSKKLYFRSVKNPEGLTAFAKSIGWSRLDLKFKDVIGTIKANDTTAVLGCSHFVVTYKREVFNESPKKNTDFLLGGNSEHLYLDVPVLKMGGYRLATYDNHAFHMGNSLEPWMKDVYDNLITSEKQVLDYSSLKKLKKNKLEYFLGEKIFRKIIGIKTIQKNMLRYKGLTSEQIKNFTS
ncbi:glycosyltransferase family A protein [Flavobacterium foetidum]|uniref:glycosyltransferase family A protein n=1 Tax=Flavobacterium foetidum TaxID=2026681 RepID=UPI001074A816|nr:glycosyltransferase family A protein [Flavobacterium foetidum]KAF2513558.1 glycosyltransferase family 2 protein [Flavobacterium foetidum]